MNLNKWLSLFLLTGICQAQVPTHQQIVVLARQVELRNLDGTSADAIAALLTQAQAPGGIISAYGACTAPGTEHISVSPGTLQQGLDYISMVDPSRKWTLKDGVILVGHDTANGTILNTVIRSIDISPNDALSLVAQRLLQTVETQTAIKEANLDEMIPPLGLSPIKPSEETSSRKSAPPSKHFENVTLEQALNSLAAMHGNAVWHFEQFKCGAKSSFRISWIVS